MITAIDTGYGIVTENITWREDANRILFSMFGPEMQRIYEEESEPAKTLSDEPEETLDEDERINRFIETHESPYTYNSGIEAVLCEVINENEELDLDTFRFEDECIYVSATIPRNEEAKAKMLTMDQIERILHKYLEKLTDDVIKPKWVDIVM